MNLDPNVLLEAAAEAATHAHAPYSRYRVGAALLTDTGELFRGCNVENASYGLTICAERAAVCSAVAEGHRRFQGLAVVASGDQVPYPCGACRQVLSEFCDSDMPILVARIEFLDASETMSLGELLPKVFEL